GERARIFRTAEQLRRQLRFRDERVLDARVDLPPHRGGEKQPGDQEREYRGGERRQEQLRLERPSPHTSGRSGFEQLVAELLHRYQCLFLLGQLLATAAAVDVRRPPAAWVPLTPVVGNDH